MAIEDRHIGRLDGLLAVGHSKGVRTPTEFDDERFAVVSAPVTRCCRIPGARRRPQCIPGIPGIPADYAARVGHTGSWEPRGSAGLAQ